MSRRKVNVNERRIAQAYNARCSGIQVDILDLSKISKVGEALIASGADDTALGDGIRAYVETIRKN